VIDIIKNHIKLILFSIFSAFIIISNTLAIAQFDQTIFSNDFSFDKKFVHSKGWRHLTLNGFDSKTNIATRGMAIYDNELYIGTQNTKFPKFFQNTVPELLEIISKFIPNKLPEFLHRTTAFKILLRVVHLLSRVTVKLVMHSAVKNSQGCEIWRYNYSTDTLTQVIGDNSIYGINSGFNYSFNCLASVLTVFKNKLYVSTWSTPIGSLDNPYRNGCEI